MNQIILGIDPGTTESGICLIEAKGFDQPNIVNAGKLFNSNVKRIIDETRLECDRLHVVIEGMANQSRAFGGSSIDTCYFIGRLLEHCDKPDPISVTLYKRHEYGRFFVNSGVLNDASLRAALETIWGSSAKKNDPLYALRGASDKRSAFALCKYHERQLAAKVKTSDFATW
jgi:hypothetical protein